MAEVQHPDLTRESTNVQPVAFGARKSQVHYELLTLREAMKRFDLYEKKIYSWVEAGMLHPVKPAGRTLYPEWELAAITKSYPLAA